MIPPEPSSAEMQKLLLEMETRCVPDNQTGLEDVFLEKEGPKILSYIRSLEDRIGVLEKALRGCSKNPGSSRRIVSQILQ